MDSIITAIIIIAIPITSGIVKATPIIRTVATVAVTGSTDAIRLAVCAPVSLTPSLPGKTPPAAFPSRLR